MLLCCNTVLPKNHQWWCISVWYSWVWTSPRNVCLHGGPLLQASQKDSYWISRSCE